MISKWNTNIRIAYLLNFLSELYLPISAWLFYYLRYLEFKEIAIITMVQVFAGSFFEVPTGAFADIVGRKKAIFLSFLLYSIAVFVFAYTTTFWIFILLEVIKGLSNSLYSGSLEALTYDTLKQENRENEYDKVVSNSETASWIGLFISAILGGILYKYWFRGPWILQGIIYLIGTFYVMKLNEPLIDSRKYSIKMIFTQNLAGFKEVFKNRKLTQATVIFTILGAGYVVAANLLGISQAREYGMDSFGVGVLFAIGYVISAVTSQAFPKLKHLVGSRKLLIITSVLLISSFVFANFVGTLIGSALIVIRIASTTTFRNTRSSIINRYTESKNRATTLSTVALLSQLPYIFLAYTMGSFIDTASPNLLALVIGITMLIALGIQQIFFKIYPEKISNLA